jgi:hypothetical protein
MQHGGDDGSLRIKVEFELDVVDPVRWRLVVLAAKDLK